MKLIPNLLFSYLPALLVSITSATAATVSYQTALVGSIFDPSASDHHHSNGSLSLSSGNSITFNTDTNTFSGAVSGSGTVFEDESGFEFSIFNFSSIDIGSGVTIDVTGSRGFALLSETHTTLDSNILRFGQGGVSGPVSTDGGDGGRISLIAEGSIHIGSNARIDTSGGTGGTNTSAFGTGSNGGNGGNITFSASSIILDGLIYTLGASSGDGSIGPGSFGRGGDVLVAVDGVTSFNANTIGNPDGLKLTTATPDYLMIPEPNSISLIVLGSGLLISRRKRSSP